MRKRVVASLFGIGALAFGWASLGGSSSSTASPCPGTGGACAAVNTVWGTACYSPLPQVGTIEFITIETSGRLLNCPEL